MKSLLFLAVLPLVRGQLTVPPTECPSGFTSVTTSNGGSLCLQLLPGMDNKENAILKCQSIGGYVADTSSYAENAAFVAFVNGGNFWKSGNCMPYYGYYDLGPSPESDCYMYFNNGTRTYNGGNDFSGGSCAYVDSTGMWHTANCFNQLAKILCQASPVPVGTGDQVPMAMDGQCVDDYYSFQTYTFQLYESQGSKTYCYKYHNDAVDQATAKATCKAEGAHLVTVSIAEENVFIRDLIRYKIGQTAQLVRLGLVKNNNEVFYRWSNWAPVKYRNFLNAIDEYGGSANNCIAMDSNGKWVPSNCNSNYMIAGFICKRKPVSTDNW